jgi:hypothetical protein
VDCRPRRFILVDIHSTDWIPRHFSVLPCVATLIVVSLANIRLTR